MSSGLVYICISLFQLLLDELIHSIPLQPILQLVNKEDATDAEEQYPLLMFLTA